MYMTADLDLSMKAVKLLKTKVGVTGIDAIVSEIGGTHTYLEQLTRKLRVANLLKSVRGPGGGYVLTDQGKKATAYDVARALGRAPKTVFQPVTPTDKFMKVLERALMNTVI